MTKFLHSIYIEDFRSFNKVEIFLNDVTCIVGANESGKTNLLDAVYLLKAWDTGNTLKPTDTRKNSKRFSESKLPFIKYEIGIDLISNPQLLELIPNIRTIYLLRNGNNYDIELNESQLSDSIVLINGSGIPIVLRKNVLSDTENGTIDEKDIIQLSPNSYIRLNDEIQKDFELSIKEATETKSLKIIEGAKVRDLINNEIKKEIKNNLKIFFWGYETKYFIPDMVPLEDIKTKFEQLPVIKALFKLGGYDSSKIAFLLADRSETDNDNLYNKLSEEITKAINEKWSTNQKIELVISHKKDHLSINIKEPGYTIEPKYRSEGLRWFLAFIIGMISQSEILKDYLILIDEPALHLHPGGQKDVLCEINRLAQENQIIYSTHSHFMIDRRFRERVLFLNKKEDNGYSLTETKIPGERDIFRDPLLRSALVYSISDISYINENNILVEGQFDKRLIDSLVNWLNSQPCKSPIDPNNTSIINCDGAPELVRHARMYKSNGLICISLYDSDKSGDSCFNNNNEQDTNEKLKIKDVFEKGETAEDLIPQNIFKKSYNNWIKENNLKSDVNSDIDYPRMNTINRIFDFFFKDSNLSSKEMGKERLRLKHDLEDRIINDLVSFLSTSKYEEESIKELINLVNILSQKILNVKQIA